MMHFTPERARGYRGVHSRLDHFRGLREGLKKSSYGSVTIGETSGGLEKMCVVATSSQIAAIKKKAESVLGGTQTTIKKKEVDVEKKASDDTMRGGCSCHSPSDGRLPGVDHMHVESSERCDSPGRAGPRVQDLAEGRQDHLQIKKAPSLPINN